MRTFCIPVSLTTIVCLSVGLGCNKEESKSKDQVVSKDTPSGIVSSSDKKLLDYLPSGANLVFGGDYKDFIAYWKTSPLKELSADMMTATGNSDGMSSYMNCWLESSADMKLAGTMALGSETVDMRMVFAGLSKEVFVDCAEKGKINAKLDEDGKYLALSGIPSGDGNTVDTGYYFINDTTAFFSMKVSLVTPGKSFGGSRSELEADLKLAAESSAVSDPKINALVESADQSKAFWFAGTAEGTPAASTLTGGVGWIDADSTSLSFGFSIEFADASTPSMAETSFKAAPSMMSNLPLGFRKPVTSFLNDGRLSADGKMLTGRFKLTNEVASALVPEVKKFLPMLK